MGGSPSQVHQAIIRDLFSHSGTAKTGGAGNAAFAQLKSQVERQHLVIQTLLMLLLEKKVIDETELRQWMHYVDMLDGRHDGRLSEDRSPVACSACGRVSSATQLRCAYCGTELPTNMVDRRAANPDKVE